MKYSDILVVKMFNFTSLSLFVETRDSFFFYTKQSSNFTNSEIQFSSDRLHMFQKKHFFELLSDGNLHRVVSLAQKRFLEYIKHNKTTKLKSNRILRCFNKFVSAA
jgi:hypothetical protein